MSISCPFLPSLSLKAHPLGWILQALKAQILIKVSHQPRIFNKPLSHILLEIRIASLSVLEFTSMKPPSHVFKYTWLLSYVFFIWIAIQM